MSEFCREVRFDAAKHGGWVLLWADGIKPQPFYWSETHGEWVQSEDENRVRWSAYEDGSCGPEDWAPLPTVKDLVALQVLTDALMDIANFHIGDCPAAVEEVDFGKRINWEIRKIARAALERTSIATKFNRVEP